MKQIVMDDSPAGVYIKQLEKKLEATERKLAEAEKVVDAANEMTKLHLKSSMKFPLFKMDRLLIEALSDYEASKGE